MDISVAAPIDIESDGDSSVMEEEQESCQTDEATKPAVDCHTLHELHGISLTQTSSLCFIYLVFALLDVWIGCCKKLWSCMVANPFVLPVGIIEKVHLLLYHPIGLWSIIRRSC
jgi:hypothetical protein